MLKKFLKDQKGDTNIVSIIIILGVIIVAALIFKPYITQLVNWVKGLFG